MANKKERAREAFEGIWEQKWVILAIVLGGALGTYLGCVVRDMVLIGQMATWLRYTLYIMIPLFGEGIVATVAAFATIAIENKLYQKWCEQQEE